jgi:hypothetical protein
MEISLIQSGLKFCNAYKGAVLNINFTIYEKCNEHNTFQRSVSPETEVFMRKFMRVSIRVLIGGNIHAKKY